MLPFVIEEDQLSAMPDHLREHYVETERGKYRLDLGDTDPAQPVKKTLTDVRQELHGAKTQLESLRAKAEKYESDLQKYQDVDPDHYQELLNQQGAEPAEIEKRLKSERDEVTRQLSDKYQKQLKELEDRNRQQDELVRSTILDSAATAAISSRDGIHQLLMPIVRNALDLREKQGRFIPVVIGKDGEELLSRDPNSDGLMSVDEYVDILSRDEVYAGAFKSRAASGGGASESEGTSGSGPASSKPVGAMTEEEKIAFVSEYGQEAWLEKLRSDRSTSSAANPRLFTVHGGQ